MKTQFYENEGHTDAQTHSIFYTSLAPSAASWDTSSDKTESQLQFFNLEKWLHFSVCMSVYWMAINGEKNGSLHVAVTLSGHASWLLRRVTAVRSRQSRNKKVKEQKGRTWQPRTTTPTSNEHCHNRAAPVYCDTIQLLVTLSKARQKPTVSQASMLFK